MDVFRICLVFIACLIVQQKGVLTYFLSKNCGESFPWPTPRIYNGQAAGIGSAPFMAFLYKNSGFHCGGSIITDRYILTAGHCVANGLIVRLGEYDTRTNPDCTLKSCLPSISNYEIEKVIRHKGYNDITLDNDIALLKLNRKIIFNDNTQPICLIRSPWYLPEIHEFQAYGWGRMANGSLANVLQTTKLHLFNRRFCNLNLNGTTLTPDQFCAGARKSDTCDGDSGSPLVKHFNINGKMISVQLGLVSFGNERCQGIGVYTYIPNYINWIWNVVPFD